MATAIVSKSPVYETQKIHIRDDVTIHLDLTLDEATTLHVVTGRIAGLPAEGSARKDMDNIAQALASADVPRPPSNCGKHKLNDYHCTLHFIEPEPTPKN